jgi:hypothetical protein
MQHGEANSVEFMGAEMAAALPETGPRQQQQQEEEDDDDNNEDEAGGENGSAPVSSENLAFR